MSACFIKWPEGEKIHLAWPTDSRLLFAAPEDYFARTRANPDYGLPGWTRDCGKRFHRGCDIAPVKKKSAGHSVTLMYSDCERGTEYPCEEPVWIPEDAVYAVADGVVDEAVADADASDFGIHVVLRHRWPKSGGSFFTLYGHLANLDVEAGQTVEAGAKLGMMGATSRIADARPWMAAFPHLHFEVSDEARCPYNPADFLRRLLTP